MGMVLRYPLWKWDAGYFPLWKEMFTAGKSLQLERMVCQIANVKKNSFAPQIKLFLGRTR